jgi:hypothetical protein
VSDKFLLGELYKFPHVIEFLLDNGQIRYTEEWDGSFHSGSISSYDLLNDTNDYLQAFDDRQLFMLLSRFNALNESVEEDSIYSSCTFYTLNERGRQLLTLSQPQLNEIRNAWKTQKLEADRLRQWHENLQKDIDETYTNSINDILAGGK